MNPSKFVRPMEDECLDSDDMESEETQEVKYQPIPEHVSEQERQAHEISHLLTWQLFGKVKPHGKEWQAVMRDVFGVTPETTHSFDMSSVNLNTVDYQCGCGDVALTIRRHNKVLQGVQYRCRKCNEILNIKN